MSRQQKLMDRLRSEPTDLTWADAARLMKSFGGILEAGSGSRRKFFHPRTGAIWMTHQPHPKNILRAYQVRELIAHLRQEKML